MSAASTDERFAETSDGLRICFRVDGPDAGLPLVLIAGLGQDMYSWPEAFVTRLVAEGFRVVRLDNRDAGRSSHVKAKPPTRLEQLRGQAPSDSYSLDDMARDTVAVLDALRLERVHLVGMSLGGMIAQTVASAFGERTISLTSIFSTTGDRRVGQPARSTLLRMMRPASESADANAERHLRMLGHIGSRTLPFDPELERAWALAAWQRGGGRRSRTGIPRQIAAISTSGDRSAALARVTAPTLVVHGDRDLMVNPSGGHATARAIPGSEHVVVDGMSHHLAPAVLDHLAALVGAHASAADALDRKDAS